MCSVQVFWDSGRYLFSVLDANEESLDSGRVGDLEGFEAYELGVIPSEVLLNVVEALGREWSIPVVRSEILLVGELYPAARWDLVKEETMFLVGYEFSGRVPVDGFKVAPVVAMAMEACQTLKLTDSVLALASRMLGDGWDRPSILACVDNASFFVDEVAPL